MEVGKRRSEAEFFSFGTNDLTQMGMGFSRDDAAKFLKEYTKLGIYERDPFQSLDQGGYFQSERVSHGSGAFLPGRGGFEQGAFVFEKSRPPTAMP